jgi:hypothetical protein
VAGDLIATPLDRSKPLWDTYLIDGLESGCAILTRMHHCIADGIALARVMLTLTDATATAEDARPGFSDDASHGSPITDALTLASGLAHEGVETLLHPRGAAAAIGREAHTLAKLLFAPNDSDSAVRGKLSGLRHVAWSEPIPLDQIKAISHAQKATVNDVLLAAVTGALRRYVLDHDGPSWRCTRSSRSPCARSTSRSRAASATASGSCSWRHRGAPSRRRRVSRARRSANTQQRRRIADAGEDKATLTRHCYTA